MISCQHRATKISAILIFCSLVEFLRISFCQYYGAILSNSFHCQNIITATLFSDQWAACEWRMKIFIISTIVIKLLCEMQIYTFFLPAPQQPMIMIRFIMAIWFNDLGLDSVMYLSIDDISVCVSFLSFFLFHWWKETKI